MKFLQQFEINKLYVCDKFWSNESRDFGFRTQKPHQKFGIKAVLLKNGLNRAKNIAQGYYTS